MSLALVTLCDRGLGGFNGLRLVPHLHSNIQAPLFFTFIWKVLFFKLTFGTKVYWRHWHVYFKMKRSMDWNALHSTRQALLFYF